MENAQYSDIDLIGKIVNGETGLFEILIRRYNPHLYRTGRSYNFDHQDTQDLMQESFIAAYIDLAKFQSRASFKTWIIRIMMNKCWHRKQKGSLKNEVRQETHENSSPIFTSANDTHKIVMNKELNSVIENALSEIPEQYRLVFTLREINGLNVAETSEVLTISEENVKVRLNRAKAMLRREIEKSYTKEDIFEFNLIYCDQVVQHVMQRIGALQLESRP